MKTPLRYKDFSLTDKFDLYLGVLGLAEHLMNTPGHSRPAAQSHRNKEPGVGVSTIWRHGQSSRSRGLGGNKMLLLKFLDDPWSFLDELRNVQRLEGTDFWRGLEGKIAEVFKKLKESPENSWRVGKEGYKTRFIFEFHAHCPPESAISKLASCAWPKSYLDSLRPTIDETLDRLEQIDRRTVRSLDKGIKKTITRLEKLSVDPSLKNAFDKHYHVYQSARNLELFRRKLDRLSQSRDCLHAVVEFMHRNYLTAFFAAHAYQVLRNKRLFANAVLENRQNGRKKRSPNTYEGHFIIGKLEEALFGVRLGELYPYPDQSPAVKKQIQRWKTEYRKTYRLRSELQDGLTGIPL